MVWVGGTFRTIENQTPAMGSGLSLEQVAQTDIGRFQQRGIHFPGQPGPVSRQPCHKKFLF